MGTRKSWDYFLGECTDILEQFIKEHTCHVQGVSSDSPWGIRTCSYKKEGSTMGVLFKGVLINKNGILR